MYELFQTPPLRTTGALKFPELAYIRRVYAQQLSDVKAYYRRYPKRVDSDNLLGNLLVHIPMRPDLDDLRYLRFVEDTALGVSRAFGLCSSVYRGRVHEGGVTLGEKTDEVVISSYGKVDVLNAARTWRDWTPLRYLYHTRFDLGIPIMNNSSPGKGNGVCVVDIPMMALQYRYWRKHMVAKSDEQSESVYRFIGSFVLPNAIDSYLDIAVFNRLTRLANGQALPKFPIPHPFYLTDLSRRIDTLCLKVLETQENRNEDILQALLHTPVVVKENLQELVKLPGDPITRHNEWALMLAVFPYVRYLVQHVVHKHRGDRSLLNDIYLTLIEANDDQLFTGVGGSDVVGRYRKQLRELIQLLDEKKHGWV